MNAFLAFAGAHLRPLDDHTDITEVRFLNTDRLARWLLPLASAYPDIWRACSLQPQVAVGALDAARREGGALAALPDLLLSAPDLTLDGRPGPEHSSAQSLLAPVPASPLHGPSEGPGLQTVDEADFRDGSATPELPISTIGDTRSGGGMCRRAAGGYVDEAGNIWT